MKKSLSDWFFSIELQIEKAISKQATPLYRAMQRTHQEENQQWISQFSQENATTLEQLNPHCLATLEQEMQNIDKQIKLLEDAKLIAKEQDISDVNMDKHH